MISFKNILKQYSKQTVLEIDSLDIPVGQTFGLVGNNGAGKTTLFNAISGFLPIDSGSISFDGYEIGKALRM